MKKILLTTSALIALAANGAMATELKITPTGSFDFQAAGRSVKSQYSNGSKNVSNLKKFAFYTEGQLAIKVDAKADTGLNYGGRLGLMTQTAKNNRDSTTRLDQSYIYVGSDMLGRVELGQNDGAIETMKVDTTSIAVAAGGATGTWNSFSGVDIGTNFDFIPTVISVNSEPSAGKRQVTYYTPNYEGLQFGISYAPDSSNTGAGTVNSNGAAIVPPLGGVKNNVYAAKALKDDVALALSYNKQVDNISYAASLTGEFAKVQDVYEGNVDTSTLKNLRSYAAGASVSYANVTLAGSYGTLGKSMQRTKDGTLNAANKKEDESKKSYWTAGLAYNQGPVAASMTYVQAKSGTAKLQLLSLGAEYKLAEGLMPYAEVNLFQNKDTKLPSTATNNFNGKQKGTVYLVGTKLQF